ncbi:ATP-dependent DNA helicase UvrD2 [Stackebrandtia nassauensis]|uniref:DNA 3'-5' helicase n=1 Tax=Stackebrandtia nassauensis (strain DSM 44728 / CIP 108903 / NRRL B-16338 / NBRC 102104 / LLR-40K-21) TaxID=446470 RepID=D3Q3W6_STANL|nr:ATP-dependent DNA helicase UvrD2 [Stackebrandtia nassauensis]ADD44033.1 UvrD/REP helicase [Stackebrandtia nassauensis DSM 44728]
MTTERLREVLSGLDDEQAAAVSADAGPVCILAGAGTGKTRAVTHRIAYRVRRGDLRGQHVLAVTFTARAAGELRDRLRDLGVTGVNARTFHAAALRQLRYFGPRLFGGELPELLDSTWKFVSIAAARAGITRMDKTKNRDLASELDWAQACLITPDEYPAAIAKADRIPPMDASDVAKAYAAYLEAKKRAKVMDFADLLGHTATALEENPDIAEQIRSQYRLFVVDEYQDVNPLQQRLLDAWLGERDDLTVVGDASQTIYTFNGATSRYLVNFTRRFPEAHVVRLVRDYRSTPQVVALANDVIAAAGGGESKLRLQLIGQRADGPKPSFDTYPDEAAEAAAVADRCARLIGQGVPASEIAVLYRTNAQSEAYESALDDVGVPTVVAGAERFFQRAEIRSAIVALRQATHTDDGSLPLPLTVATAMDAIGWRADAPPTGGAARERHEAVAALVRLAEDHAELSLGEFVEELGRRAAAQHAPSMEGVTLASLHSAKGLEWDAVFLVGLAEGTLPTSRARTRAQQEEERRLLYVGITRARRQLFLSYGLSRASGGRPREASSFLAGLGFAGPVGGPAPKPKTKKKRSSSRSICRVCGATLSDGRSRKLGRCEGCPSNMDEELFERLRQWRKETATRAGVPAYVVFTDVTLTAIAERCPKSDSELVSIAGIGARKLEEYGAAVLALVAGEEPQGPTEDTAE